MTDSENNPWIHPDFHKREFRGFIMTLDPDDLRKACYAEGLLSRVVYDMLGSVAVQGRIHHHEKLLQYVIPQGRSSFVQFVSVLHSLGYSQKAEQFSGLMVLREAGRTGSDAGGRGGADASRSAGGGGGDGHGASADAAGLRNRERLLCEVYDIEELGEAIRPHLSKQQCVELARRMVKDKLEEVNNYRNIVEDYMSWHNRGETQLTNVPGLIYYYIDQQTTPTCAQLLELIKATCPSAMPHIEKIIRKTEFS